jgi:hypothetical protein
MHFCKIGLFKGILNNNDHQKRGWRRYMYRDVSVNLSTLKIETNPGKPLEFFVESYVGTLRI